MEQNEKWESESQASILAAKEEADVLHTTLREIANSVIRDTENTAKMVGSPTGHGMDEVEDVDEDSYQDPSYITSTPYTRITPKDRSPSPSRAIRLRSISPTRARTPAVADSAVSAVQSALKKRQLQVQVSINRWNICWFCFDCVKVYNHVFFMFKKFHLYFI